MSHEFMGCFYSVTNTVFKTLAAVVLELDKTLFESYVQPKSQVLKSIVRGGILDSSMDWFETPQPKGV